LALVAQDRVERRPLEMGLMGVIHHLGCLPPLSVVAVEHLIPPTLPALLAVLVVVARLTRPEVLVLPVKETLVAPAQEQANSPVVVAVVLVRLEETLLVVKLVLAGRGLPPLSVAHPLTMLEEVAALVVLEMLVMVALVAGVEVVATLVLPQVALQTRVGVVVLTSVMVEQLTAVRASSSSVTLAHKEALVVL
jgi:hypothetical protein